MSTLASQYFLGLDSHSRDGRPLFSLAYSLSWRSLSLANLMQGKRVWAVCRFLARDRAPSSRDRANRNFRSLSNWPCCPRTSRSCHPASRNLGRMADSQDRNPRADNAVPAGADVGNADTRPRTSKRAAVRSQDRFARRTVAPPETRAPNSSCALCGPDRRNKTLCVETSNVGMRLWR